MYILEELLNPAVALRCTAHEVNDVLPICRMRKRLIHPEIALLSRRPATALLLLLFAFAVQSHADAPAQSFAGQESDAYKRLIEQIETSGGAYSRQLPETLLGLGLALQSSGRHAEAIAHFKRGVHLARINGGLYSADQIPLLQGEISSHIATRNLTAADDRQRYLYRVQMRAVRDGETLTKLLMQQADWQFHAHRLGVGPSPHSRLVYMHRLYSEAHDEVMRREGEHSPDLLAPLKGLLRTRYLIADSPPPESSTTSGSNWMALQDENLFRRQLVQNYTSGQRVIAEMGQLAPDPQSDTGDFEQARASVMLGDWHLYHGKYDAAGESYRLAVEELAALDDAKTQTQTLLGHPVALPDIDGLRPLPRSSEQTENSILIEYSVSPRGRVRDIRRLDNNEALDATANRVIRALRRTRFRPRFENGEPVETVDLVYAVTER